jgi:acetyltransferase-like isoleucine patch superfamily enzyme
MLELLYRSLRKVIGYYVNANSQALTKLNLAGNGVIYGKHHKYRGIPYIKVNRTGKFQIGDRFSCNSGDANPIGRSSKTQIVVGPGATLKIGNYVGMSNTAINCYEYIQIEDHVKIGGGVVIYDTDFHSIDYRVRAIKKLDLAQKNTMPIRIERHAFIGAHSTILKGVTIGARSIIGACSVVTKNIPSDEIWAGNPAKFVRKINLNG